MKRELFLNEEQRKIVEAQPNGNMLVKGVAGSGKTTIATFKLYNLSRFFCGEDDEILCLTYNRVLSNHMERLYDEVTELKQSQSLFELPNQCETSIKFYTVDQVAIRLYYEFYNAYPDCVRPSEARDFMQEAIKIVKKDYPTIDLIDEENIEFLHEEITWMMACGYTDLEVYQTVDRTGRNGSFNNRLSTVNSKSSIEPNYDFNNKSKTHKRIV